MTRPCILIITRPLISRVLTHNKKTLVIAAISSRPYVKAAVDAGFDVISIDGFADSDTRQLAKMTYQVRMDDMQLDSRDVLSIISQLESKAIEGFCYGAGFEPQPALLEDIGQYLKVIGNSATVVQQAKNPRWFFECCDRADVPYPNVLFKAPQKIDGWLQKTIGGSGGAHVQTLLSPLGEELPNVYFQKHQIGRAISCLFLAEEKQVHALGFNEQWVDSSPLTPFRYGGAVSQAEISARAKTQLVAYIKRLIPMMGLAGLSSCDAVVDGDDVYVLEINPRLCASMDLYGAKYQGLMAMHIAACCGKLSEHAIKQDAAPEMSVAHKIIYADADMWMEAGMQLPDWVRDVSQAGGHFKEGAPLCTVIAEASTALLAKNLVHDRVETLRSRLLN